MATPTASPRLPLASSAATARAFSSPKRFVRSPCFPPRRGPRLRAGSVKEWREFEDEAGASKEWREFEDAVRRKDLSRALRFLQSVEPAAGAAATQVVAVPVPPGRDWEVLDACIDADDMRLVGRAYQFLVDRGVLDNFGKCKKIVLEGPREVTPTVLKEMTGLEATADAIFLGGTCLAQISSFWPPFKRRILVHEAGHLLTAYLMGCPIRGVILDPFVALRMGIQGQGLNSGMKRWKKNLLRDIYRVQYLTGTP
ncbi:hypothetical protein PVAP13_1KG071900 [Panicum virgatum]|uniref:Uncharacterized protein n=1 Tax=Panicum virgatum TaxID=38727 RepID=A0A8T0XLF4_PANVG|nr:hypothetical protein PVAP13_1KG071900 [Panicum virgatum]